MSYPRAAVTGFAAFHPLFNQERPGWIEYTSHNPPSLAQLYAHPQSVSQRDYESIHNEPWWERFFACGIIGEPLSVDPLRFGACLSSSKGRPAFLEKSGKYDLACAPDWGVREVLKRSRARGKTLCPVAACAGGAHAVALAAQWIEDGYCDAVLCGAVEAELAPLVLAGYRSLGALSKSGVMRPFDSARDGFVPSSGAAVLLLENEELAKKRGAKVWGRVAGWSVNCDATSLTGMEPSGDSIAAAMRVALKEQGRMDYVNAHGTATRQNDAIEARAIHQVLGGDVPVSSTKSLTGHMLGAAGVVEAVLCLLAMRQGYAPPNGNLEEPGEDCRSIDLLRQGREMNIERAMSLSYGFGGHIGVLLLEK